MRMRRGIGVVGLAALLLSASPSLAKDKTRDEVAADMADSVIDGLKALRGLENRNDFAPILPLLQNPDANIKRDSCRTLAVVADKSVIPKIEPLLKDPDKKVQKDAEEAIATLKR